jgi:hypothetical protein
LKVRAHGDRDIAEDALEEPAHVIVAPLRQMHEGEMPEEMVLEVAQVIAGVDAQRQEIDAAGILAPLVEHVGDGVHGPRIPGIHGDGLLGQGQGLVEAPDSLRGRRRGSRA